MKFGSGKISVSQLMLTLTVTTLVFTIFIFMSSYNLVFGENTATSTSSSPLYTSTREYFDTNNGSLLQSSQSPVPSASSIFDVTNNCPNEIAIYVHGVWASKENAEEQTERVNLSLQSQNYSIPLIGFTWDSNTSLSQPGWNLAKIIAHKNAPLLGKFIIDFKEQCPNSDIRIIAHSLGSRVVLSALEFIMSNPIQLIDDPNKKMIKTVHLMGSAVDNEDVSLTSIDGLNNPFPWILNPSCTIDKSGVKFPYGKSIQKVVEEFYNLVNSEDNVLEISYRCAEGGNNALGQSGKQIGIPTPPNYHDVPDIESEIIADWDANADGQTDFGLCISFFCDDDEGSNHNGYMGFRDKENPKTIDNDGVMNVVVEHWR
jgi:hypothetical protein